MGMMIAKSIQTLEYLKNSGVFPFNTKEGVLYTAESINVVIDTMRKYQKIQVIIKDWEDGRFSDAVGCLRVKAVLEDGKND